MYTWTHTIKFLKGWKKNIFSVDNFFFTWNDLFVGSVHTMVYKSIEHIDYGRAIFNTNIGFIEVLFIYLIFIKMYAPNLTSYESFSILKFSKLSFVFLNIKYNLLLIFKWKPVGFYLLFKKNDNSQYIFW